MTATTDLRGHLGGSIRELVAQRGPGDATPGPSGALEPAWVQGETEQLLEVVNDLRALYGLGDVSLEAVRLAEHDAARHAAGHGYEEDFARRLAELVTDKDS